jgi:hypothetical protein
VGRAGFFGGDFFVGTIADMPDSLRGGALTGGKSAPDEFDDDDGYDGPLDFAVRPTEAGIAPMPKAPDAGPESWLNNSAPLLEILVKVSAVLMETGEVNLGNGHIHAGWPETFVIEGLGVVTRKQVNHQPEEAATMAVYANLPG